MRGRGDGERSHPSRDALILLSAFGLELPLGDVDEILLAADLIASLSGTYEVIEVLFKLRAAVEPRSLSRAVGAACHYRIPPSFLSDSIASTE